TPCRFLSRSDAAARQGCEPGIVREFVAKILGSFRARHAVAFARRTGCFVDQISIIRCLPRRLVPPEPCAKGEASWQRRVIRRAPKNLRHELHEFSQTG